MSAARSDYFAQAAESARQVATQEPSPAGFRCVLHVGHAGQHLWVAGWTPPLLGECLAVHPSVSSPELAPEYVAPGEVEETLAAVDAVAARDPEPTEEEIARWQRELERDMRATDRTPIGVTQGHQYGLPVVVCRDGTVWRMQNNPAGPEVADGRLVVWEQSPSIPGSPADQPSRVSDGDPVPEVLAALKALVASLDERDIRLMALTRCRAAIAAADGRPS